MNDNAFKKTTQYIVYTVLLIFSIESGSSADVIVIKDGMIINGKIIKKTEDTIIISNYNGTFIIKNKKIKEVHETKDSSEDIKILTEKGIEVNKEEIIKNYESGIKAKKKIQKEIIPFIICYLSPALYLTTGELSNIFPYGYGISIEVSLNLDDILYKSKNFLLPDVTVRLNYFSFSNDSKSILGYSFAAGPIWSLPVIFNGNIYLSLTVGGGMYNLSYWEYKARTYKLKMSMEGGFTYFFSRISLKPFIRYTFVNDNEKPLHFIAFGIGAGYIY